VIAYDFGVRCCLRVTAVGGLDFARARSGGGEEAACMAQKTQYGLYGGDMPSQAGGAHRYNRSE
jgi:hypothetical protein